MFQIPYNVERILLMAANMDTKLIKQIMTDFETQENGATIPPNILDAVHQVITGKNVISS